MPKISTRGGGGVVNARPKYPPEALQLHLIKGAKQIAGFNGIFPHAKHTG